MNIMRNPRKMFKGVHNSRKTEMNKMKRDNKDYYRANNKHQYRKSN